MFDNYIIETRFGPVGIVVRDGRQYRFFAAHHAFNGIEGRLFKNPKEAEKAALRHAGTTIRDSSLRHPWPRASARRPSVVAGRARD